MATSRVIAHPGAKALAAGARALREQAKPYAFDAHLYEQGHHTPHFKRCHTEYQRLLRWAAELEQLAGRRKAAIDALPENR